MVWLAGLDWLAGLAGLGWLAGLARPAGPHSAEDPEGFYGILYRVSVPCSLLIYTESIFLHQQRIRDGPQEISIK